MTNAQASYAAAVEMLKEIVEGRRGWLSIHELARDGGFEKRHLAAQARLMGLNVKAHGRYGLCAFGRGA